MRAECAHSRAVTHAALIVVLCVSTGCVHRSGDIHAPVAEPKFEEIRLSPTPRVITWDSATDIPKEKMVWIEVFNGVPRVPKTEEPISDVRAYVDDAVGRLGEVWVVVDRIHLKSQPIEKDKDVIDACKRSRARAVILREAVYLGSRLQSPPMTPETRLPNLSELIEKSEGKAAQPGATDNPGDAQ